ncbi:MAG TPA: hypothetical protein VL918_03480 [Sphingobium sp.]|nr:hypothetical protein [Sphingobium sp.]
MDIRVYRRSDAALVVVPGLFQPPVALEREGALRPLGTVEIELNLLSDELVADIGLNGYAIARGPDEALIRTRAGRRLAAGVAEPAGASR